MSDTTMMVLGGLVVLAIFAIVIGRRMTSGRLRVGGLEGEVKGQQPGAAIEKNLWQGKRLDVEAEGSGASIRENVTDGEDIKIKAKS